LIKSVKEDTAAIRTGAEEIKTDTITIKRDTSQIAGLVQEIGLLRLQISHLEDHGGRGNVLLERFLAQSTTYAESVVDTGDFGAVEFRGDPASPILEEGGTSDLESTHASENLGELDRAREIHSSHNREQMSPFPTGQRLHLVSAPTLPQASDALGPRPPDHSPVDLLADPPEDGNALISQGNEPTQQKPQLELDHKAIEIAAMARRELSAAEQGQLDEELLFLLDNRKRIGAANPVRNRDRYCYHIGTLSEVVAVLDRGADPRARTGPRFHLERRGLSALVIEIINAGRLEVIRLLLGRGADVNAEGNNYSGNALIAASARCEVEKVRTLLEHGADVRTRHRYSGSALDIALTNTYATSSDQAATVDLLRKAGAKKTPLYSRWLLRWGLETPRATT
jgi:hypothetical protein